MKRRSPAKKRTFRKRSTIASLQKAVRTLQKKTQQVTENDIFEITEAIDNVSPYSARNLCNYSGWNKLWPSTATALEAVRSKMYHKSFTIDNMITLDNVNNEEGLINFTYFIVSRKDTAGTATDTVNALSLTSGVDYNTVDGKAFLNLKKWKIHFMRRFSLTGGDGADMQADLSQKRIVAKIRVGKKVENPDGGWRTMTNSPDPSDTYYALLFSNNSSADLENPRWTFNCIHSVNH